MLWGVERLASNPHNKSSFTRWLCAQRALVVFTCAHFQDPKKMWIKGAFSSADCVKCQNKLLTTQSQQRSGAWANRSCEEGQIICVVKRAIHFSADIENLLSEEDDSSGFLGESLVFLFSFLLINFWTYRWSNGSCFRDAADTSDASKLPAAAC